MKHIFSRLQKLSEAHAKSKTVSFLYTDEDGNPTKRWVDILNLRETKNGDFILVGRCHTRDAVRSFRLDRLKKPRY